MGGVVCWLFVRVWSVRAPHTNPFNSYPSTPQTHHHSNAVWKPLAGFLWFVSLIGWEILFGLAVSTVALHINGHIAVRFVAWCFGGGERIMCIPHVGSMYARLKHRTGRRGRLTLLLRLSMYVCMNHHRR